MKISLRVFAVTILAIVVFWVLHSILVVTIFEPGSLFEQLFQMDSRKIFIVLSVSFVFFIYAFYISSILKKNQKLNSELKSNETFLDLTLLSIGDAVIVADKEGRVLKLNKTAEILTGWRIKDAFHKHIDDVFVIINEITRQKAENPFKKVVKEGKTIGLANHTALISKDGKEYSIADSAAPIFKEDGTVAGAVIVFRDVSQERIAQKELQFTLQKHDSIISHTADAVLLLDEEARIIEWNKAMEKITLLKKEDVLGQFQWDVQVKLMSDGSNIKEKTEEFKQKTLSVLKTGKIDWPNEKIEFQIKRVDGTIRHFEQEMFIIPQKKKYWLASVTRDITERKAFIENLKLSEEKFSSAFEVCQDSIIVTRKVDNVIVDINPKFELEFGYKKEELVGKKVQDVQFWIYPEQRKAWIKEMSLSNQTLDFEAKIATKKGFVKDILVSSVVIDVAGEDCIISYNKDITEKKQHDKELQDAFNSLELLVQERTVELETTNVELSEINRNLTIEMLEREKAEQALKESEKKYRVLIDHLPLGVYRTTIDGKFLHTNPALAHILGFESEEELKKHPVYQFYLSESDRNNFLNRQRDSGDVVIEEVELENANGERIWVRDTGRTIFDDKNNPLFTDGIIEDITCKKQSYYELEFQYSFLQILMDTIPNPIYYKDAKERRYIGCNLAFLRFFGKTKEEIIGKSVFDMYSKQAALLYDEKDKELLSKRSVQKYEDCMKDAEGNLHYNMIYRTTYNNPEGDVAGIVGIVLDITDITLAQEQLSWESSLNSTMAELSQALLSEMSLSRISEMVLEHGKRLTSSEFGYIGTYSEETKQFKLEAHSSNAMTESLLGKGSSLILHDPQGMHGWVLRNKESVLINNPSEDERSLGTPAGHFKIENFVSAPVLYKDQIFGSIALANSKNGYTKKDLLIVERLASSLALASYRIEAEEGILTALFKQQELNELKSKFISTVSHEYRTPLQVIMMSTQLLSNYEEQISTENRAKYFNMIEESVKTMDNFLNDITSYNKVEKGHIYISCDSVDIEQFILSFVREMQFLAGEKCVIDLTLKNGNRLARLDQKIVRQILESLINNAIKFSPINSLIKFDVSVEESYIEFTVEDEGAGISESDQDKIFDPFFRGKNVGNSAGTGLGLSIVKNYIDAINGSISFESALGKGSTFIVKIPIKN